MKCYLVTKRHDSIFGRNWLLFWGPNRSGYTSDIRNAGVYEIESNCKEDYPIVLSKTELRASKAYSDFYIPVEVIERDFRTFHLVEVES